MPEAFYKRVYVKYSFWKPQNFVRSQYLNPCSLSLKFRCFMKIYMFVHIGQTGRNFETHFKEHIQAIIFNNTTTQKLIFAEHVLETKYEYSNISNSIEILDFVKPLSQQTCILSKFHAFFNVKR
jgi:hypothetical protein